MLFAKIEIINGKNRLMELNNVDVILELEDIGKSTASYSKTLSQ